MVFNSETIRPPLCLRTALREETRSSHQRVDALFGALDLTDRAGLTHFLQAHLVALVPVENALADACLPAQRPPRLTPLLDADLEALGALVAGLPQLSPPHDPHPLGLSYVIAGAHFGTAVLRRQWSRATDPAVRRASRYFSTGSMRDYWRELEPRLARYDRRSDEGAEIVRSAKATFGLFERAFDATAGAMTVRQ